MSAQTVLTSISVPFALSSDSGVTYKNVVCKKLWNLTIDGQPIEESTDCGNLVAAGVPKFSFDVEFVLNQTPSGGTEWTVDQLANFAANGTNLYARVKYSTTYIRSGNGLITNYKESAPQNGMVQGTFTFTGNGAISIGS